MAIVLIVSEQALYSWKPEVMSIVACDWSTKKLYVADEA